MSLKNYLAYLSVLSFIFFTNFLFSQNLLVNGDFESGGNGVGFSLNGAGYNLVTAPFSGTTIPGNYAFTTNPLPMNTANFILSSDHTSGVGNMMIIDGNSTGGNQRFWRAGNTGGGVCGLTIGQTYTFSYWIRSVSNTVTNVATQSDIGIQFNNVSSFSLISGNTLAPLPASGWIQVIYAFTPSNACVNIELWNSNTNVIGNDFAVDDFAVLPPTVPLSLTYSIKNSSCFNADDAAIVVYSSGGITPYVSYTLSGPINSLNNNGVFTGLIPGNYTVSVTDSNTPPTTISSGLITITEPSGLIISPNVIICPNGSTTLNVSGGGNYVWTSSPNDSSLTTPNSASPIVSPSFTTIYSVTSTSSSPTTSNLIYNGDFSLGNVGFATDYQYLTTTVVAGAQTVYGIVTNPSSWFAPFANCVDHTTGTGNMIVVDGSTTNGGNNRLWCQTIPVNVGQNYTFSYWIQSVVAANPANIEVVINGIPLGTSLAPNSTCGWVQVTYNWNSGVNNLAQICIYDRNTAQAGNDFSIDDIVFTTNTQCNMSGNVTVFVAPAVAPVVNCGVNTGTSINYTWNPIAGATGYTISYTINGGTPISGGTTSLTNFSVTGLTGPSNVIITVTPFGNGCFTSDTQSCTNATSCPIPIASVTTQPTCTVTTGTIVFTSPLSPNYEYSINGIAFQANPTFLNVAPGSYNVVIRNLISGCISNAITLIVNSILTNPTSVPLLFCDVPNPNINPTPVSFDFNNVGQTSFSYSYSINGGTPITGTFLAPSHFDVTGLSPGQTVAFTLTWNGVCTPSQTVNCTLPCSSPVVPTFTSIPIICSGNTLTALPTLSNNGFSGTWSPALNNTTTTTYTFTPTAGQCASTTTLTITVTPQVIPTFVSIPAICFGGVLAAFPTTSTNGITGTWSPALNNTATTTYTFTPTAGLCAATTTLTIIVNPLVTPTFVAVSAICTGGALVALPTTSTNGISGTWSPALNNTATTTYTFTPTAGLCATTTTLTITINPLVTPTFVAVPSICSGNVLSALPTTSTNGITGSWSPALNNTATTTYTFTPTTGLCATTTTLTITVNPLVTPTFATVPAICSGVALMALPTTSTNGITGTWSPALNNTATTTYTFTPSAGQCSTSTNLQIIVYSNSAPTIVIQQSCGSNTVTVTNPVGVNYQYSLDGQAYQSNPTFSNLTTGNHSIIAQQTSSSCFTNPVNFFINNITNDVIVFNPQPLVICDTDDNDGVRTFDLTQVVNFVTGGNPYTVTFHETLTDAQFDATFIPNPNSYDNINPWSQIIYIRVESLITSCFEVVMLQLIVNPKPTAVEPIDLHVCDNGDAQLGFVVFDLTVKEAEILGSINPATHSVTYYETLGDAQLQVSPIVNPTIYTNTVVNTQTIWVVVETTATGCFDIVELQLVVDPLPLVNQPAACVPYTLCETGGAVGFEVFDLQTRVGCILLGQLGMSVTFYPSLTQAQSNTGAITNLNYTNGVAVVQTLGIRVTNVQTGCYVISTMDIRVEPLPVPIAPLTPYTVCDTDQNGLFEFDLTTLTAGILGANPTGNTLTYHETQTDAQLGTNSINTALPYSNLFAFSQTLWVAVVNPITLCRAVMPIQLRVNESPRIPDLDDIVYCDEDSNNQNASTLVNLSQQTALILAAQTVPPASNYTVTYYTSLAAAQTQTGNIINTTSYTGTNGETIYVVVRNNTTGCIKIGQFQIIINIPLALVQPAALSVCDDDAQPNNGFTTFDLTVRDLVITSGMSAMGYTVTYYPSYANALAGINQIINPTAYINISPAVQTLGVKVTSPDGCRSYITMDIRVLPVPTPNTTNIPILPPQCEDVLGSGQQFFDLTVNENYILNGDPNVTAHYFHTLANATAVPPVNEIPNPSLAYIGNPLGTPRPVNEIQYIYIAVTSNIFTEYTGANCYTIVRQPFIVNPLPIANAIGVQQICEEDPAGNDGIEEFDLTSYSGLLLAGNNTTPLSTYVVTFYTDAGLTNQIANPSAYNNTSNPQTIYVRVTTTTTYVDPVTGITYSTSCSSVTNFDIIVNPKPSITQPAAPLATCDNSDGINDGYQLYSLASLEAELLNGQNPTLFTVTFYQSEYNPDATPPLLPPAIANTTNFPVYTHTFWAAVTNNATGCFKTLSFNIVVEQTPEPFITNNPNLNVICVDFISGVVVRDLLLESENQTIPYLNEPMVPRPTYTYQWYEDGVLIPGATSDTYLIDQPLNDNESSIFTLIMTSQSVLGCSAESQDYLVLQSGQAIPAAGTIGYTVTNAFSENQIITVTVEGYGTYQYSLDDGPRQDSPIFENVSLGEHIITVWDTEGGLDYSCDPLIIDEVQTIDYPHYFTPNGDGIHDYWNIVGLEGQPTAKIYIFDRHGKLIKQISSQSEGWDGTYNGQQMFSTDYWFMVDYSEQGAMKKFRAHFALKR